MTDKQNQRTLPFEEEAHSSKSQTADTFQSNQKSRSIESSQERLDEGAPHPADQSEIELDEDLLEEARDHLESNLNRKRDRKTRIRGVQVEIKPGDTAKDLTLRFLVRRAWEAIAAVRREMYGLGTEEGYKYPCEGIYHCEGCQRRSDHLRVPTPGPEEGPKDVTCVECGVVRWRTNSKLE